MYRYIGQDKSGIPRVWGEGPTADIAERRCCENITGYVREHPSTGPISHWTVVPVVRVRGIIQDDLPSLLESVHSAGFLVNNLFQCDDGSWRASLRTADLCYSFGDGTSPAEALRAALSSPGEGVPPRKASAGKRVDLVSLVLGGK